VEDFMSGEKGGSKADTLVKVVLFFFISLLSFSVGTFVGKQVSDSDHRRMALEGEYNGGRNVASAEHGEAAAHDTNGKITEKEVDALTEEFVNREKTREPASHEGKEHAEESAHGGGDHKADPKAKADVKADGYKAYPRGKDKAEAAPKAAAKAEKAVKHETKVAATDAHAAAAKVTDETAKTADKVAEGHAPTDGAAEEKAAPPTLPSVASSAVGKYTVQVGSYLDEKEAKTRSAELKGKGWNAFYLPATVKGKTWYRVLVGLFNNQESAKQFRAQFMKEANTQAAIVQKIVQ
jgi:cell division protein FtsN